MSQLKPTPEEVFGPLFIALHRAGVREDGKAISDSEPVGEPSDILEAYLNSRDLEGFNLNEFFETHFRPSESPTVDFEADTARPVQDHIVILWDLLTRSADADLKGGSLLPLPHPYIVPGGRFNEIYYWDSYFTMLGLQVSRRVDLIESMIDNFTHFLLTLGFIPNGNRTYFQGRSQPPFYALMVQLLAGEKGQDVLLKYLPALRAEYRFWMDGGGEKGRRLIELAPGERLNRYYDDMPGPRPEMYMDDMEIAHDFEGDADQLFTNIRAACESGWDFSGRWMKDPQDLSTMDALSIIPVDLNCLLWNLEIALSDACGLAGEEEESLRFRELAYRRWELIEKYHWNRDTGYYHDYNHVTGQQTPHLTAAGMFPMFFHLPDTGKAVRICAALEQHLLRPGGIVTTTQETGQQWDAPNGWAPLQWIAYAGCLRYGFQDMASRIRDRWISLNEQVYKRTGKLMEKYNVEDLSLLSGGGEYPVQDGFGWTNGVLLRMLADAGRLED